MPTFADHPDTEQALAEEAAARFADQEDDEAISLLMGHLKEHGKNSLSHRPWQMLMDIYQARKEQASFEKLASMFAGRFNTSPPSWRRPKAVSHPPQQSLGRNVLIISGQPSKISPDKRRDFLAAARAQGFCRLDISRMELTEASDFIGEAQALSGLLDRMTRLRLKVMLMGDGQLIQILRQSIDAQKGEEAALRQSWLLLLVFLQWRGNQDEFELRAMAFADRFDLSPPGYEADAVLALDSPDKEDSVEEEILDEAGMQARCASLAAQYQKNGSTFLDFEKVFRVTYPAAMALSAFLVSAGFDSRRMEIRRPSEMLVALFDSTGVSSQVSYAGRGR
jgi:hypothetical protein